jgi:D-glycero-alpha-D-manno-heptose-7-phosphate kinase
LIIAQTPLRISFFGGGTDFPDYFLSEGGCVLSSAINKFIFVTIKERFDDMLRIGYTRTEIVESIDEISHELIRESLRKTGVKKGVEIITMGDIPAGSGLGSSSAVTVGALHAMYAYRNTLVSTDRLAEEACDIEVNILGKPIGFQDQYIAAFGGLRFIEFQQNGRVITEVVNLDPEIQKKLSERLLLYFSGITRKSESILTSQKENISQRLPILRKLKEMAYQARESLCAGSIDDLGYLLHESWQLKKQLAAGISNSMLEDCYQAAIDAGAYGGKVTGAGGGGFLMLYCPLEKREQVRAALSHLRELPFQLEPGGSKVIFNYRY